MLIYIATINGLVTVQCLRLFTNFQVLKALLHEVLFGTVLEHGTLLTNLNNGFQTLFQ